MIFVKRHPQQLGRARVGVGSDCDGSWGRPRCVLQTPRPGEQL